MARILERRQTGVLVENLGRMLVGEVGFESQPLRYLGQCPPVGFGLTTGRQKTALTRDTALGVGHGAVFFAPATGGQEHVGNRRGVGVGHAIGHHHQLALRHGGFDIVGIGHADQRVGGHDPEEFDLTAFDGVKHLYRLEAGLADQSGSLPETPHPVAVFRRKVHVSGELIGESTDFAASHGIGLSGNRKRGGPWLANAPGGQMRINNAVALVGARTALVDALRI